MDPPLPRIADASQQAGSLFSDGSRQVQAATPRDGLIVCAGPPSGTIFRAMQPPRFDGKRNVTIETPCGVMEKRKLSSYGARVAGVSKHEDL